MIFFVVFVTFFLQASGRTGMEHLSTVRYGSLRKPGAWLRRPPTEPYYASCDSAHAALNLGCGFGATGAILAALPALLALLPLTPTLLHAFNTFVVWDIDGDGTDVTDGSK